MTRRAVRLFVLLGLAFAAYLVLCLFDHAARAEAGSIDQPITHIGATVPVDSVKTVNAGVRRTVPEATPIIPKSTAPQTSPPNIHRPAIKVPEIHPPKVRAPKIRAPKIQASRDRPRETVRRVQIQASNLRQPTSDAARALVTSVRTELVRQNLSAHALAELPDLPQAELAALPLLPSSLQLPGLRPAQLPGLPTLPSWSRLPGRPQAHTPVLIRTTAGPDAVAPYQLVLPQLCPLAQPPAPGPSGVTTPPAAPAQPGTVPIPATPRPPADRSTPTGQARDSGGSNAPAMGTVPSSWRPDVAAAGRRPATGLIARGRTVRYAGPPS